MCRTPYAVGSMGQCGGIFDGQRKSSIEAAKPAPLTGPGEFGFLSCQCTGRADEPTNRS